MIQLHTILDVWCVRVSGPVARATSAAVSTDAFSGSESLREKLARSLITTTATTAAGKKKEKTLLKRISAILILLADTGEQALTERAVCMRELSVV